MMDLPPETSDGVRVAPFPEQRRPTLRLEYTKGDGDDGESDAMSVDGDWVSNVL